MGSNPPLRPGGKRDALLGEVASRIEDSPSVLFRQFRELRWHSSCSVVTGARLPSTTSPRPLFWRPRAS
jgi:hypothetical protein